MANKVLRPRARGFEESITLVFFAGFFTAFDTFFVGARSLAEMRVTVVVCFAEVFFAAGFFAFVATVLLPN